MQRSPLPAVLAWLAAALFAVGAWLALPRERGASGPPVQALLVDASASAAGMRGALEPALRAAIEERRLAAADSGLECVCIAFGRGARRFDLASGLGAEELARGEDRSDLAAGLSLCEELARAGRLRSIDVLGDGSWTGADPSAAAARLAAQGVRITVSPTRARMGHDAHVAPLASPIRVRRGEPVRVRVETWRWIGTPSGRGEPDELVVAATLAEEGRVERREVRLPAEPRVGGPRPVRVDFEFGALATGGARLEVGAELRDREGLRVSATPAAESVARALVLAEGALAVGVPGGEESRRALADALGAAAAGLSLVALDAARADALDGIEVLATMDFPFDREAAAAVDAFVAAGGGWVDFGGERFASGARPASAALAPAAEDERPREIAVLVDASGSMAGDPATAARAALARLVDGARVEDGLSARWFAADAELALDLGRPGQRADAALRRAALERVASAPEPRGPTRIWSALETFARGIDGRARTLAILVSDGRDPDRADIAARAARLRADLASRGAELSVIAVGSDPDRDLLAALAGGPAGVLDAGDLGAARAAERLVRLLESALASGSIVEDPDARAAAFAGARDGLAAPFAGIAPPAARRFARARAADRATVVWTAGASGAEAPLLALARRGLGLSAGFAFLPDARWVRAPEGLGGALATALRAVAPPADRARMRLVERDGELVLEGVPQGAPAIVRAELRSERGGALARVDLLAARAGRDPVGERSAPLPEALAGLDAAGSVSARIADLAADGAPLVLTFSAPRAPEHARVPSLFVPPAPGIQVARAGGPGPHPTAPWVLIAGLVALAGAVGAGFFSRSGRRAA